MASAASNRADAAEAEADPNNCSLQKFKLYETRSRFYLIGSDKYKRHFRVLKIHRTEASELHISEDPVVYTGQEVNNLLQRISEGNRSTGGLTLVTKAYGIAGCIKFLESYYLILVTKRRQIGCICGHAIYGIEDSQLITIPHSSVQTDLAHSKTELRYKKLLSSVDLTKDFFYSYTYPIMQSLQKNVLANDMAGMQYENLFVWNAFLTRTIRQKCNNTRWTVALVHGNFRQVKLSIFGRVFVVTLISRRSRHFAGTRYLKRGVNDLGRVANDVETEQIVLDEDAGTGKGKMSSVVQMRGSIPLFWSQEASRLSPKPDIILQRYDPTYQATKLHFEDLARRYGNPIIVLNLIKTVEKRPREMMLRREFANAVGYLNQILLEESRLKFIHWDFHKFAKSKSANVLAVLGGVASEALELTGFYYSGKPSRAKKRVSGKPSAIKQRVNQLNRTNTARDGSVGDFRCNSSILDPENPDSRDEENAREPRFQSGVLRTNCIDCLDRTNVAQFAYGLAALGHQLHAMGLSNLPKVDTDSSIAAALMDMYQSMGDALAIQYGGSAAHNTVFTERQGKWKATTQSREFLKSIKRYYSNAYTDGEKQDAINLFLGYFQPQEGKPALWELDSDYYLHVGGNGDEAFTDSPLLQTQSSGVLQRSNTFAPIPACKEDSSRIKLTSFDKLMQATCSSIKNVRIFSEPDSKLGLPAGNTGTAPDAAEIQLKSPNWLFGQRKVEGTGQMRRNVACCSLQDKTRQEGAVDDSYKYKWLSSSGDSCEREIFERYLTIASTTEVDSWYGSGLLFDTVEDSEAYKHYAECCQGPALDPFGQDAEKELYYSEALHQVIKDVNDTSVVSEMEAALNEYNEIGRDLGTIIPSKLVLEDPTSVTRWILGEEKMCKVEA
ncbi:phosphatidylinositol-3-phosphatase SAC1 [Cryptomeria japonica]|uniref:phosphatidylinositol-3-phosphatase SAC1 n=1 Tax=Cryptomeria japonica TaxID=3369 RepID=UPI0025ACE7B4|nr:phosphatidylinositol-3-phosphatase SAC1 [Cryptomeria japonica]